MQTCSNVNTVYADVLDFCFGWFHFEKNPQAVLKVPKKRKIVALTELILNRLIASILYMNIILYSSFYI